MRSRLPILILLTILVPALFVVSQETTTGKRPVILLDQAGKRGIVYFNHSSHESLVNPDSAYPYKAKKEAACSGCHHTVDSRGVIQLVACAACHQEPGNSKNPMSKDGVEQSSDEAFHRNCMGCHRANQKGPRLCGGCHKMTPGMTP